MLITTIDQLTTYVTAAIGSDFKFVKPYVKTAEMYLRDNVLGAVLYNKIEQDPDNVSYLELIELCRNAIALGGYYEAIPMADLIQTNNGFAVVSNSNHAPASKDRVLKLRNQTWYLYDVAVEAIIAYLFKTTSYHDDWKASNEFSEMWNVLLPTATEFNKRVTISGRSLYQKIRPNILWAQNNIVAKMVSVAYINEIIETVKDASEPVAMVAILPTLRNAIAKFAFANAIDNMAVNIDENGVGRAYQIGQISVANEARLSQLKSMYFNAGKKLLADVLNIMDADLETYSTYATSAEYAARNTSTWENTEDSKIFVFNS